MRNLVQFPITAEEIDRFLTEELFAYHDCIGSTYPLILSAIQHVLSDPEIMKRVLQEANPE
jgi:hypothetical protein